MIFFLDPTNQVSLEKLGITLQIASWEVTLAHYLTPSAFLCVDPSSGFAGVEVLTNAWLSGIHPIQGDLPMLVKYH